MAEYSYYISTEKLLPPIGGVYTYAAKLAKLVRNPGPDSMEVKFSEHRMGEMWGKTEEEAYQKVLRKVEDWIAQHKD